MSETRFTLVFNGDLRRFGASPFKTETPFGFAQIASIGDVCAERDLLVDALEGLLFQDSDITEDEKMRRYLRARHALDIAQGLIVHPPEQ